MTREAKHTDKSSPETEQNDQLVSKRDVETNTKQHATADTQKSKSVAGKTHVRKPSKLARIARSKQPKWQKILSLTLGSIAVVTLAISAGASQYYKNKVMPNVYIGSTDVSGKTRGELEKIIESKKSRLQITLVSGDKKLEPQLEELGIGIDRKKTVDQIFEAKRRNGLAQKLKFWQRYDVSASSSVNDMLLDQYVEAQVPELKKAPQDSRLEFDSTKKAFIITPQSDGEGVDTQLLKRQLLALAQNVKSQSIELAITKKSPTITEAKLAPLLDSANQLSAQRVVLSGMGYVFQATATDIASWLTPTPQEDGSVKLIVDGAKVQSYVELVSKRISSAPVDRKIVTDPQTGQEVVIQEGRDGTELAEKSTLVSAITNALESKQGITQPLSIKTASFQTVNMEAYEKWIEVDLSEQRTTAYERATPVKNFIIASGMKGHETVIGEFEIWHKNRKQTMRGGSKADGSYYSIPNVEWVTYFYKDYALHGAWWREKFGYPASHGCVNMTNEDAKWVYEWAPMGAKVIVHQ